MKYSELRKRMVEICRLMNSSGLNQGTSGNLSVRLVGAGFLITPSGMSYEAMRPEDIVEVSMEGDWCGKYAPSTEWRMHRDILRERSDALAVLHTHSLRATALSCHLRSIPAFHYMVAAAGGKSVRCAPYALFGSQELADAALKALESRRACLLGHHGLLALGDTPEAAFSLATEVETLSAMYIEAMAMGEPPLLSDEQMSEVLEAFSSYGCSSRDADL